MLGRRLCAVRTPQATLCSGPPEKTEKKKSVLDKVFAEGKRADVLGTTVGNVVVEV